MRTRLGVWVRSLCLGVIALPATEVAKPPSGLTASRPGLISELASWSRDSICSGRPARDVLVVTGPSTTTFSPGTSRSGPNVPDRSSW